mgnify:CR=1 FL=1
MNEIPFLNKETVSKRELLALLSRIYEESLKQFGDNEVNDELADALGEVLNIRKKAEYGFRFQSGIFVEE